jgi:hypothetical protein
MPSWVLQGRRDFYDRFAGGEQCLECFWQDDFPSSWDGSF